MMKRASTGRMVWVLAAAVYATIATRDFAVQANPQPAAKASVWTLGIYAGPSPLQLRPAPAVTNPVLTASDVTDMKVDAVAHPFLVIQDHHYYMFFTAKDLASDTGGIGLAESSDGMKWRFRRTVIREPFVLSHPFVFEWHNEYYLIPEAHTETSIRLYKATTFPDQWNYVGNVLEGDITSARRWHITTACGGYSHRPAGTTHCGCSTPPISGDPGKNIR